MFGSNPFGQSSSSRFGSQPNFGQINNASSNPFAPKPFGSTSPFGSQTGGSIFGGTSTGVFGAQSSSPLSSSSVFGASSSPAFGSSTPTFGASSGSSMFGQKPTFGGFGSTTTQTSPFGASFQQSQPAFGSNVFGSSSPFGAQSQPAFGALSQPAFGAQTIPAFGSSSPAFGSTTNPTFGNSGGGFGASSSFFGSSMPTFSASTTPVFGATTAPAFGIATTPAFGATTTSAFGASAPAFGASSTPSFNFGSSPGQATSTFGNNQVGVSAFGAQTSPCGAQTPTSAFGSPGFGQSTFGAQRGGSRVSPYLPTPETDGTTGTQPAGKLESISAMPVYKDKSHEELRWEDYQIGDKGGPAPGSQATSVGGFGNVGFGPMTSSFGQTSANQFSSLISSYPFAPKPAPFSSPGFGPAPTTPFSSSAFGPTSTSNIFGSTTSATPSLFGSPQTFGVNTSSFFSSSSTSGFGSPSIFGASSAQGAKSAFGTSLGFGNTLLSPLFQSTTPTLPQHTAPFGQNSSVFGQTGGGFFSTPPTGFANNLFSSTSSLISSNNALGFGQKTPSLAMPFQPAQPMSFGGFNFSNFDQSQSATTNGTSGIFYNGVFAQSSATQSSIVAQAAAIANPFGTLPAMPQMSIGRAGTAPSIQCGIASLPVVEKPAPVKLASPLTSRHLSQRRLRLPVRKYNPIIDRPKVSFFNDQEPPSAPKADALFVPRENPRALVIRPLDPLHSRSSTEKTRAVGTLMHENGKVPQDGYNSVNGHKTKDEDEDPVQNGDKVNPKASETRDMAEKRNSYITLTGHRAGEAAIAYEHGADIEALMPKLRHSDYFTEPRIQELAAKERAEPGFCRHVRGFVVGRHSYGSIKFFGETDVRRLDLESLVQFNNQEVIVYMDESKKPPVGQGLNKRAEVTLLNIKCFDKKTGQQLTEGPRIEKYREMLRRKGEDQRAEFVSYDAVKGEWKFKVDHFSRYRLGEGEEEEEEEEGCYE